MGGNAMNTKKITDYSMKSVHNALDILEQFAMDRRDLNLTELVGRLHLQKNNVFRLLATLESCSYVERDARSGNYRLGSKVGRLRESFARQSMLMYHARPYLEELARSSGETASVAILRGFQSIVLDAVAPDRPVYVAPPVGRLLPGYCSAAGKMLLTSVAPEKVRSYFEGAPPDGRTDTTLSNLDTLLDELDAISDKGHAVADEEMHQGVCSIAVPVFDYHHTMIGAVALSGLVERFTPKRIEQELLPTLQKASVGVAARFGFNSGTGLRHYQAA